MLNLSENVIHVKTIGGGSKSIHALRTTPTEVPEIVQRDMEMEQTKVGTPKMAPDLKAPSTVCVHF